MPRTPEDPTPEMVLQEMTSCEPYTVADLLDTFDAVSRWTIQRRLETLHDAGFVRKKKHAQNRVSWWVEAEE